MDHGIDDQRADEGDCRRQHAGQQVSKASVMLSPCWWSTPAQRAAAVGEHAEQSCAASRMGRRSRIDLLRRSAPWGDGRAAKIGLLHQARTDGIAGGHSPELHGSPFRIMPHTANRYGGVVVKFKPLLDRWKKDPAPARTAQEYPIRLSWMMPRGCMPWPSCFPGQPIEDHHRPAACRPRRNRRRHALRAGPKVISRDDQGDPVYEDIGLTPRFVELTRKFKKSLAARPGPQPRSRPGGHLTLLDGARLGAILEPCRPHTMHLRNALGGGALPPRSGRWRLSFQSNSSISRTHLRPQAVMGFLLS
jgi:hypothetical protein